MQTRTRDKLVAYLAGGRRCHPHPISGETAPVTMGHEFSGVIEALFAPTPDL
ncbi:hypothetical protein [Rothia nasimurium]|uniref:hypothetical protein n=1 Tax=Rothia nasimurium TaxID=85336 RepID=UPI002DD6861D|nr:hypothetical protein [Rothia nasimurium]